MRRSTLWMCALVTVATSGCKQVSDQYAKIKETIQAKIAQRRGRAPTPPQPAPPIPRVSADTPLASAAPPPAAPPAARGRRRVEQAPELPRPARDVPYESPDTGTIAPGMGEKEIYALWGPPISVRHRGEMTFLYFRNGCEYTCGWCSSRTGKSWTPCCAGPGTATAGNRPRRPRRRRTVPHVPVVTP